MYEVWGEGGGGPYHGGGVATRDTEPYIYIYHYPSVHPAVGVLKVFVWSSMTDPIEIQTCID